MFDQLNCRRMIDAAAGPDPDEAEALADAIGRLLGDHRLGDTEALARRRRAILASWDTNHEMLYDFIDQYTLATESGDGDAFIDWLRSGAEVDTIAEPIEIRPAADPATQPQLRQVC